MCSGKTTLAKKISKEYNIEYIDLDEYIENKYSMTISEIFNKFGEEYFRKIESNSLKEINKNVIISTGGGTPCYHNNMEYMNTTGITIYVYCDSEILLKRLFNNKNSRPLLSNKSYDEIQLFFKKSFYNREQIYNQCKYKIDNSIN